MKYEQPETLLDVAEKLLTASKLFKEVLIRCSNGLPCNASWSDGLRKAHVDLDIAAMSLEQPIRKALKREGIDDSVYLFSDNLSCVRQAKEILKKERGDE